MLPPIIKDNAEFVTYLGARYCVSCQGPWWCGLSLRIYRSRLSRRLVQAMGHRLGYGLIQGTLFLIDLGFLAWKNYVWLEPYYYRVRNSDNKITVTYLDSSHKPYLYWLPNFTNLSVTNLIFVDYQISQNCHKSLKHQIPNRLLGILIFVLGILIFVIFTWI